VAAKQQSGYDPRQRAFSLLDEFKAFAFKGNVIDLAVGVVIGAAFAKIIDSLVKHIIMPLVALAMPSDQSYTEWKWVINGKEVPYGLFLGEVVNFLIVALALFVIVVKLLGWLMRARQKQAAAEAVAVEKLSKDQELLTEIRDLLKKQKS
jgi:large conductance mechanosensitive channel